MTETRQNDAKQKDAQARKRRPPVAQLASPVAQVLDPAMVQLALADPTSAPQASILYLQRNSGNRAVQRLIQRSSQPDGAGQFSSSKAAAPTRALSPAAPQKAILTRPAKSAIVHPNRGALPKANVINRPKSLALPLIQMKLDSLPLAGEAEAGLELEMDGAYVPPVAPPPGLPKGKPNKGHPLIQTKLSVGSANEPYERQANQIADRVRPMTNRDLVSVTFRQTDEAVPV